jgi:hypothetical protein
MRQCSQSNSGLTANVEIPLVSASSATHLLLMVQIEDFNWPLNPAWALGGLKISVTPGWMTL